MVTRSIGNKVARQTLNPKTPHIKSSQSKETILLIIKLKEDRSLNPLIIKSIYQNPQIDI